MAVRYECHGSKVIPVATIGDGNSLVSLCGPDLLTHNGIVISDMPYGQITSTEELNNPVVIRFRSERDIELMIKDLKTLKDKFNSYEQPKKI